MVPGRPKAEAPASPTPVIATGAKELAPPQRGCVREAGRGGPSPYEPAARAARGSRRMNQFGTPITGSWPTGSKPKRS